MTTDKIKEVVEIYRQLFRDQEVEPKRMNPREDLKALPRGDRLSHAYFLLDGVVQYAEEGKEGKCGRHLGFIQAMLCYEGFFTLEQLMDHNRPEVTK